MNAEDRRSFLKRLAKTTAYAAPLIQSFAAPADLVGQSPSSKGHGKAAASFGPDPAPSPWNAPAPGMQP
ncbi:MAG: hypothetical protein A2W29_07620 [Gemmatimonadetes bacterium RBG_16_66_8]|nr:MAG: hypothetical protein A2W29_07620 [Gemmatimonadetes bacterium RBG_16_66_8]